jgi:hypothetical protein
MPFSISFSNDHLNRIRIRILSYGHVHNVHVFHVPRQINHHHHHHHVNVPRPVINYHHCCDVVPMTARTTSW